MAQTETATLGGDVLVCGGSMQRVKGIESVKPGYAGGLTKNPTPTKKSVRVKQDMPKLLKLTLTKYYYI